MLKWFAEKISTHMLSILVVAITPTLGALAIYFRTELMTQVQQATPQALAISLLLLALGCLTLFAWVLYLLPSFKYIPKLQIYQHRVNGLYYCPKCRNKKPLTPLKSETGGWRCTFSDCRQWYENPDYKLPDLPAQVCGPESWLR